MRQELRLRSALAAIARAQRALKEGLADRAEEDLDKTRIQLENTEPWPYGVRIDNAVASPEALRPSVLSYRGMWRPPAPPESPEDLGCDAIVCSCLVLLRNSAQVRQHWETGCFDCPEFETDRAREDFLRRWGREDL